MAFRASFVSAFRTTLLPRLASPWIGRVILGTVSSDGSRMTEGFLCSAIGSTDAARGGCGSTAARRGGSTEVLRVGLGLISVVRDRLLP